MNSSERVLLFGGSGKLGQELLKQNPLILAPKHQEVDITDLDQVKRKVLETNPTHIIHAAAIVGKNESEKDLQKTYEVNVTGTENITSAAKEIGCRFVFISSVSVFDGNKGNYSELDLPNPTYYYGVTKLQGEQVTQSHPNHVIIRTDFFVPGQFKYSKLFSDHYCSKMPVQKLAEQVLQLTSSSFIGIIHLGSERGTLYNLLLPYSLDAQPITIAESTMPNFPKDLSLDISLYKSLF